MSRELTVRELSRYVRLNLRIAAGGPGLDRPVRWAHSTELLDPRPYLNGGELVLTVGSGLTDPERCVAFAHALAECRVAALGLGIGDVHNDAPAALLRSCEEASIPLLLVPRSTPFIEITELLAEYRIRMAADRSRRETTGRLINAVLQRQATPELLRGDLDLSGLKEQGLVASLWQRDVAEPLEHHLAAHPHLIGEFADVTVLLTQDADGPHRAATAIGVPCTVSEPFPIEEIATILDGLLDDWGRPAPAADPLIGGAPGGTRLPSHYTYLVNCLPQETLDPILADLIDPLVQHDEASGAHLVDSLESFLEHDGSVQAAARTMHLHPNSLRHRLARIHEMTGRNPLLLRDQVDFAIALQALHRRQHTQPS